MLNPKTEEHLSTMVSALNEWRYLSKKRIEDIQFANVKSAKDLSEDFKPFFVPFLVTEQEKWFRFRFHLQTPKKKIGSKYFLSVETGIHGGALTSRPQGLLLVDGNSYAGIDIYHMEVLLPEGEHVYELVFYTHEFFRPFELSFFLTEKDEEIERTFYDFLVPFETISILDKKDDNYLFSLPILEKAINLLDFRVPYSMEFYSSLKRARDFLEKNYYGHNRLPAEVKAFAQTHIDVAWLWDLAQTHEKARRSFSTVLSLMKEYPNYHFFSSTPLLYEFIKKDDPNMYAQIKKRVEEGRFEPEGSFWLECDCNLVDGESFIRQILYGKRFFKKEFGVDCHILYEPDVFGYSAALPQIMKLSGIDTFVTAKIGLNDTNRMPYSSFVWKGIDGSEVFATLLSTCHSNPRHNVYDEDETTYVGDISSSDILGTYHRYESKDFSNISALAFGWGDGGGGPTREMLEKAKRYEKGVPGMPKLSCTSMSDAVLSIKNNFEKEAETLHRYPLWDGELYFEYHRGTYTSVPEVKKNNRDGESLLQRVEFLASFAGIKNGLSYPKKELEECWKILLLNQFHDILPGSAIEKVYADSSKQFHLFFERGRELEKKALDSFVSSLPGGGLLVFNSNSFPVQGPIHYKGKTFVSPLIPAMGYRLIQELNENAIPTLHGDILENEAIRVCFSPDGRILSLWDKKERREVVEKGKELNELIAYEDRPFQYDNWELASYYEQKPYAVKDLISREEIHDGERVGIAFTYSYCHSLIRQEVTILGNSRKIDFKTELQWNEPHQILKAHFPFALRIREARYDIQYGSILRPTTQNDSWQSAKFEVCGQKWADMSEHSYGVALLNDGKYGYAGKENDLSLTLVKGGAFPNPSGSKKIPVFTYSLLPHSGGYEEGNVIEEASILNRPLLAIEIPSPFVKETSCSLLSIQEKGVYVEHVKQTEDRESYIFRIVEEHGDHHTFSFCLPYAKKAYLVDLMENRLKEIPIIHGEIDLELAPFQIFSLEVCL